MRVATFNVHGWTDRQGRSSAQKAIELLRTLACDAVVLQEVPEVSGTVGRVAGELGMHYAYADASFLGNALLSAAAPESFEVIALSAALAERRSAFVARLPWEGGMFTLWGTHLDHLQESTRLTQLEVLLSAARERERAELTLLAGDFNALCLSDYGAEELARIRAHRQKSRWEPPMGDVTATLEQAGWVDLYRLGRDSDKAIARDGDHCEGATCWAGTRIDYLWAAPSFREHARLVGCERVLSDVSDHVPVVAEIACRG